MKQSPGPHAWPRTWQRFLLLFLGLVNLWSGSVTYKHHLLASLGQLGRAVAAVLPDSSRHNFAPERRPPCSRFIVGT